jgi:predicted amidohydrolase
MTLSRRKFFGNMAILGAGVSLEEGLVAADSKVVPETRLPREVWIGTTSLDDLPEVDYTNVSDRMLKIMSEMVPFKPDIICLTETFPTSAIRSPRPSKEQVDKDFSSGAEFEKFSNFAKENNCYIILPFNKTDGGVFYNSATLINRQGQVEGDYKKIHPTESEIDAGILPGPLDAPVFQTDFGVIGMQICFDINWQDSWQKLSRKGAEIIFWPSAFAGGGTVNTAAWQNRAVVVSSTIKGTAKICDISGQAVGYTGFWNKQWTCAPVNLEKAYLHLYPYINKVPDIQKKYGRSVNIEIYHEEERLIIESLSPELKVGDIMKEFGMKTYDEHIYSAEVKQKSARTY